MLEVDGLECEILQPEQTEEEKIIEEIQIALDCDLAYAKELYLIAGEQILYYIG